MLSKTFIAVMNIHATDKDEGIEFVTASGAMAEPMGVTKKKGMFALSYGTPRKCKVSLFVTVVDTTTYDALLGMEFMAAVGGCYDTCTEMFKYRRVGPDGLTRSFEIFAPCHLTSPPLVAYGLLRRAHQPRSGAA